MSESVSKLPTRKTGLSPKQQKLQAMLEKMKNKDGAKGSGFSDASAGGFKAKGNVAKKTSFQRKAT